MVTISTQKLGQRAVRRSAGCFLLALLHLHLQSAVTPLSGMVPQKRFEFAQLILAEPLYWRLQVEAQLGRRRHA